MQKKNLIYIIGGAAIVGYFLYMKKKNAPMLPAEAQSVTPDQALAPAFVNETTDVIKKISKTAKAIKSKLKRRGSNAVDESGMMTTIMPTNESIFPAPILPAPSESSEGILLPQSPLAEIMQDMSPASKKSILTAKAARQSAKSTKQEIRASGGSAKQARQAAKAVRKEARAGRKMGELSVTF